MSTTRPIDDFVDLTAFQRDVLWTLAREDGLSGATVKATLEARSAWQAGGSE